MIYSGSRANGAIYAADLRTGQGAILVPGQAGRVAVGLSFDARTNYIFAAGGPTGKAYVYDASTGALVREYTLTAATGTFINDVIVTRDAAYFTDSLQAVYYRVPLGPGGRLAAPNAVETIPLSGDFQFVPGQFNSNGIEVTPNGDAPHHRQLDCWRALSRRVADRRGDADRPGRRSRSAWATASSCTGAPSTSCATRLNQIAVVELAPDLQPRRRRGHDHRPALRRADHGRGLRRRALRG